MFDVNNDKQRPGMHNSLIRFIFSMRRRIYGIQIWYIAAIVAQYKVSSGFE